MTSYALEWCMNSFYLKMNPSTGILDKKATHFKYVSEIRYEWIKVQSANSYSSWSKALSADSINSVTVLL